MKILHLLFCCLFFFTFSINSQVKSLKVLTDHHFYLDPSSGEYIELAFQFDSENIHFVKSKFDYSANISLKIIVSQDSTDFVNSTYLIDSPKFRDSLFEDFIDVRRFLLKPGKYLLSLSFKDINSSQLAVKSSQFIIVPDLHSKISISDIQVCENIRESKQDNMLTKSGYDLFPRLLNYFSSECKFLPSYLEIYNPFKDSLLISLKTSYYSIDKKKELNYLTKVKHFKLGEITPIIQKNEISDLPTGSYKLVYSVLKDSIELCATSYYFDRTNEFNDVISIEKIILDPDFNSSVSNDSLKYYLLSIIPISNESEIPVITKIVREHDDVKMRSYLQSFWVASVGRLKASNGWLNYKVQLKLVEKLYKTSIFNGFETDRGRVYLKYGPPSAILIRETSPSEYPYEIWQYDKIKQFSNKRFIFYNPDLVNNHYQLLHSDMQGELKNYRWQQILTKRNSPNQNIDDPNDGNTDHYGGESSDVFKQF